MLIGSHLSIAGGMHNALLRAAGYGFRSVALFVRNQRQWRVPPLDGAAVRTFHAVREETGIGPVVAHGSYLVNLRYRKAGEEKEASGSAQSVITVPYAPEFRDLADNAEKVGNLNISPELLQTLLGSGEASGQGTGKGDERGSGKSQRGRKQ